MKIAYIGSTEGLVLRLTERLRQEGHDVYILSNKDIPGNKKNRHRHRFYRLPRDGENYVALLRSIKPDAVIFSGGFYYNEGFNEKADNDIMLLKRTLSTISEFKQIKFILLSSTKVYGNTDSPADESAELLPVDERGVRFLCEEQLVDVYKKQDNIDTVILRVSWIYTLYPREGYMGFLSRNFTAALKKTEDQQKMRENFEYQPIFVGDLVDAINRVLGDVKHDVYNVCGSHKITAKKLYQDICKYENVEEEHIEWKAPKTVTMANSDRIREELGWNDIHNLENQLENREIKYEKLTSESDKEKKRIMPATVRQTIENVLIFALFFFLSYICRSHDVFSKINWLLIYVIVIAVGYNIYQSALAAIFASAAYLFLNNLGIQELNTFYNYADTVLVIAEFVFLGLIVSYTTNVLRERVKNLNIDLSMLKDEYEDLKSIDDENILIKNEYEDRLLTTKTGFPKLYKIISKLTVDDPDRILMETMQVIADLVNTKTVAVYQGTEESSWFRLIGSLNSKSAIDDKASWNISDFPKIFDSVKKGKMFIGEFGTDEPAVVMPIHCGESIEIIILIKKLPYESDSLYSVNQLNTMSKLLKNSIVKALQYEELSREIHYIKGTDILLPDPFKKRVLLEKEKSQKFDAEFCVAELIFSGNMEEAASSVKKLLRVTDRLGTDGNGKLFALLIGTGIDNLDNLQKRLLTDNILVSPVLDFITVF